MGGNDYSIGNLDTEKVISISGYRRCIYNIVYMTVSTKMSLMNLPFDLLFFALYHLQNIAIEKKLFHLQLITMC